VAGQHDTRVLLEGRGLGLDARAAVFDPRNDLAVLRVPGLDAPALPLAPRAPVGASAAILGFPLNGPYDVRAARVGATRPVTSQDAYGRGPVQREMTTVRGLVRSGNSGGPVVDSRGRVVGTIFAAATSGPQGGYAVPNDIVRDELGRASGTASTGPCTR
jgi:S1-C subfamily serine protease